MSSSIQKIEYEVLGEAASANAQLPVKTPPAAGNSLTVTARSVLDFLKRDQTVTLPMWVWGAGGLVVGLLVYDYVRADRFRSR